MDDKPMKILIIEDDINDCNKFIDCAKSRNDIEIVAVTDSDITGLKYVQTKSPEGIVLDLELNNSTTGNTDSLEFLSNLKKLRLKYEPIVIVTTHVNSKRTYEEIEKLPVEKHNIDSLWLVTLIAFIISFIVGNLYVLLIIDVIGILLNMICMSKNIFINI